MPYPTPRAELRLSEEVYRVFCTRVARGEHPLDPDGHEDIPACEGAPERRPATPTFAALLSRRPELVTALDEVFGDSPAGEVAAQGFAEGELGDFVAALIPFYDDDTLPAQSRSLGRLIDALLGDSPVSVAAIEELSRMSARAGYRAPQHELAVSRPLLSYTRADEVAETVLPLIGEGGAAHDSIVKLLRAAALELAEPAEPISDPEDTTLHLTKELLFRESPELSSPTEPRAYFVRRDRDGNALTSGESAPPFPIAGREEDALRDEQGRAVDADGAVYTYQEANSTLLAALLREQKPLMERKDPNTPSTAEKAARGLRVLLGPDVPRTELFTSSDESKRSAYAFTGPDVEHSPLLDLAHAMAVILQYPETERALALMQELLANHESASSAPVYAGLAVDDRSDRHPEAFLVGIDGTPDSPKEFWDDLLSVFMREVDRPGMITAAHLDPMTAPETVASFRIYARLMKYKDDVSYNGAPLSPGFDGRFSDADAQTLNSPVSHTYSQLVDRSRPGLDVGLNRSALQRIASANAAMDERPSCNKQDAILSLPTGLGFDLSSGPYDRCTISFQPDSQILFPQSVIGRARMINDPSLDAGDEAILSELLPELTQLDGFGVFASPRSLARLGYGPWNRFLTDLMEPAYTRYDGLLAKEYEPNALFALEIEHADITVNGKPQSYLTASAATIRGYDDHEYFDQTKDGPVASKGYMYLEPTNALHLHYDSRRDTGCPLSDDNPVCRELGLTGLACAAGCTQSLDPSKPYYARQSNFVSYEPLISEAIEDDGLTEAFRLSALALASVNLDGKSGSVIMGELAERLLKPDPSLRYRDGRTFAVTNTCVPSQSSPPSCDCPVGTTPADDTQDGLCAFPDGRKVQRGRVIEGGIPPLYLVLDAFKRIEQTFALPEYQGRHDSWLEARSALVDQFVTVLRSEPLTPGGDYEYRSANQRSRNVTLMALDWLLGRIRHHREQGQEELSRWALGLPDRLASVLGHPLVSPLLDLLDILWKPENAAAARELAGLNAYLLDSKNEDAFAGLLVAVSDTLELLDRDAHLTPLVRFAATALADNASAALDSLDDTATEPDVEAGLALQSLRVSQKTATLKRDDAASSPMSRLLANGVLPNPALGGRSPFEVIYDAVADVNRSDPAAATDVPHAPSDIRSVLEQLHAFVMDPDHGLERTYTTIRNREVHR